LLTPGVAWIVAEDRPVSFDCEGWRAICFVYCLVFVLITIAGVLGKRPPDSEYDTGDGNKAQKLEPDFQSVPIHNQGVLDGSLEFVEVGSLECSGLSSAHNLLYVREDAKELWGKLTSSGKRSMLVIGPPGVGKSTIVWAYASYAAKQQTVYWAHLGRRQYSIAILNSQKISYRAATSKKAVISFINACRDGILIADGLTEKRREKILVPCSAWQTKQSQAGLLQLNLSHPPSSNPLRRLIVVSSESLVYVYSVTKSVSYFHIGLLVKMKKI